MGGRVGEQQASEERTQSILQGLGTQGSRCRLVEASACFVRTREPCSYSWAGSPQEAGARGKQGPGVGRERLAPGLRLSLARCWGLTDGRKRIRSLREEGEEEVNSRRVSDGERPLRASVSSPVKQVNGTSDEGLERGSQHDARRTLRALRFRGDCCCFYGWWNRPRSSADMSVARAGMGRVEVCVRHRSGLPGLESGGRGVGAEGRERAQAEHPRSAGPWGTPQPLGASARRPGPRWSHRCLTCWGRRCSGQACSRTGGFTWCTPVPAPRHPRAASWTAGGCAPPPTAAAGTSQDLP